MMKTPGLIAIACLLLARSAHAATVEPPVAAPFGTAELDASIEAKAKEKGIPLAGACDDATFLRRLSLDLTGVIPTPQDVEAFLADARPDKRALKIEELMGRPDFDRHWADQMRSFMMGKAEAKAIQIYARNGIEEWLEQRLRNKDGYDKIVSQLITAEGPFLDNPATGFLMKKDSTPEDITAKTGKVFLGAQIQCAQCHDHPFEKWKQTDFYGMVSFFSRTRTAPLPEPMLELVRKGVPVPMVRQLILGPMGGKVGKLGKLAKEKLQENAQENGVEVLRGGNASPAPGAPGAGFGQGRYARRMNQNISDEERVRRMMKRMGMDDAGGMGMAMTDGTGTGTGVVPPQPAEIVAIATRIRAEIEADMADMEDVAPNANGKKKKPFRRIPVVFDAPRGEAVIPDPTAEPSDNPRKKKGTQVAPRFLDGTAPTSDGKRRQQLAEWMTRPDNPYFARAAVNRFFALLTGQPLVAPVDNIVMPSDKTLVGTLDQLATAFVKSGYDLRWLCRTVVSSRSYQRDLAAAPGGEKGRALLSFASARQLSPEQLFASFLQATGAETMARGVMGDRFERLKENFLRQFVFTFENDEGAEVELFHETIPQALMLMNSGLINRPVQAGPGGMLASVASASADPKQRIDRLYLATLSRHARPDELEKLAEHVSARGTAEQPDMPGMDDPAPPTAREFLEDMPGRRPGKRFGLGMGLGGGAMGQLRNWRDKLGMKPRPENVEPGGWAGMVGMRARFQNRGGKRQGARAGGRPGPMGPPDAAVLGGAADDTAAAAQAAGGATAIGAAGSALAASTEASPGPASPVAGAPASPVAGAPASPSASASARAPVIVGPNPWKSPGERQAYEDIFWSLVSCSEFLYNH